MTVRAYRPRRRAVIEVVAPTSRLFVKVLRPTRVRDLHERHRLLTDAGMPTPHSLGWTAENMERNVAYVQMSEDLREGARQLVERSVRTARDLLERGDVCPAHIERGGRKAHSSAAPQSESAESTP